MRSLILVPAYLSAVSGEESSSLIQLRLHREDTHVSADPAKAAIKAAKAACRTSCNAECCADTGCNAFPKGPEKKACKKDCRKTCKPSVSGKICTAYPLLPTQKKCRNTWKKDCKKDLGCNEQTGEMKEMCNKACKMDAKKSWDGTACTTFVQGSINPGKLCNQFSKKKCIKKNKCNDKGEEKAACKKSCHKASKGSWKDGACTLTDHTYTKPAAPAPVPAVPKAKPAAPAPDPAYEAPHVCGAWSEWGQCSTECGGGLETRTYKFLDGVKCGIDCPHGDGDKEQRACNTKPCAVDCDGSWGEYSSCSATCGGGVQKRMYSVSRAASHGGKACPAASGAEEVHPCSTEPCEKDCEGHWEDWSECSNGGYGPGGAECGPGGEQSRVFKVDIASSPGGCDCDNKHGDIDTRSCDLPCCPEDCEGSWGAFGECVGAKTGVLEVPGSYGETEEICCGGGTKTKSFSVTKDKVCGGECCEAPDGTEQTADCCTTPCPIDCVGDWEDPCACSAWCGNGTTTKVYKITTQAEHGGKKCPHKDGAEHSDPCFLKECPIDCAGRWGEWSGCSEQCEDPYGSMDHPEGSQTRKWIVTQEAKFGGEQCSNLGKEEVITCGPPGMPEAPKPCPIDAECAWEEWGECSANCSNGPDHYIFRTRKWIQIKAAQHGGKECLPHPPAYEPVEEPCEKLRCPIPCIGHWSKYGKCTAKLSVPGGFHCGGGSKTRTYIITQEAQFGGTECCNNAGDLDSLDCGDRPCEVPCIGEFSEWTDCCATCGGGTKSRTFGVSQAAKHGGPNCTHNDGHVEVEQCGMDPCPIDCEGSWSSWTECSQQCTDCQSYGSIGSKTRKFTITVQAAHGGKQCPEVDGKVDEKVCNDKCCPVDCVGSWDEFSACSSSCGNGVKERFYRISQPALYGGVECPRCDLSSHTVACNDGACPVHCSGQWSAWSHCSKECDGGEKTAWFLVNTHAQNGGDECDHAAYATKKQSCNEHDCVTPCQGGFGLWSKCSKPCGGGSKNRTYTVRAEAKGMPAIPCFQANGYVETKDCNMHDCPEGYVCSGHCD